jgi:hypothetical protein
LVERGGVAITYKRGNSTTEIAKSVVSQSRVQAPSDDGGFVWVWTDRDFIVEVGDLTIDSVASDPREGDRIVQSQNGKTYTFEVLAIGLERGWRYADSERTAYRIHTKEIRDE